MDKTEHGARLKRAIGQAGSNRQAIADTLGVALRTVTNWTSGSTMPSERERATLRVMFPGYDAPGDEVESAVRRSELVDWRQSAVITEYKRHLHEQRGEATG